MNIRLEPFAWMGLVKAAAGYEMRCAGRGRAFVRSVRSLCQCLAENPAMGRRVDGDLRQFRIKKSPYSIVYGIHASTLLVVAIVDGRRKPGSWQRQTICSVEDSAAQYVVSYRAA